MKKITTLAVCLILASCGGRAANPIMVAQYGDDRRGCEALELEMQQMQDSIQKLMPKTDKTGKNVALGVTGAFFIIPLFFMDLSQSEQIEVNAYRERYNHLAIIATDKGCGSKELLPAIDQKAAATKAAVPAASPDGKDKVK